MAVKVSALNTTQSGGKSQAKTMKAANNESKQRFRWSWKVSDMRAEVVFSKPSVSTQQRKLLSPRSTHITHFLVSQVGIQTEAALAASASHPHRGRLDAM
jgi:hypothetical protein